MALSGFIRQMAAGGSISKRRGLSALGVKPGVADLILLHDAKFHALELKAHAKSKVSKAQKQFIADVKAAGGEAEIAFGLDHALRVLERWQLLRGRMK
jgi:hypothetical protein